ncbi:hypothetical protein Tco_1047262, partial [Tanacetum coccineum]
EYLLQEESRLKQEEEERFRLEEHKMMKDLFLKTLQEEVQRREEKEKMLKYEEEKETRAYELRSLEMFYVSVDRRFWESLVCLDPTKKGWIMDESCGSITCGILDPMTLIGPWLVLALSSFSFKTQSPRGMLMTVCTKSRGAMLKSNNSETDSEISLSVFDVRTSDEESTPANDMFSKVDGYHVVPPPITGNFLTPRADISFVGQSQMKKILKNLRQSVYAYQLTEIKVFIEDWNSDDEDDVSKVQTVSPVKTNETQTVKTRVDKIGQTSQKQGIGFKKIKACFVCKSTGLLIKIWINERPKALFTIKRSYYTKSAFRPKDLKQDVKTFWVQNMTTAGTRSVVNTGKDSGSFMLKKFEGKFQREICYRIMQWLDNVALAIMPWQQAYLSDYEDYNGGFVAFRSDPKGGTQDSYVAGSSGKDKEPTQEYILLPLHPHRTRIPVEDVAPAAHEKPFESSSKVNDVQDSEDVANKEGQHQMTEDVQVLHDELEKMIAQEVIAKALDDATDKILRRKRGLLHLKEGSSDYAFLRQTLEILVSSSNNEVDSKDSSAQQSFVTQEYLQPLYKMKAGLKQCKRNCCSSNYKRFGYLLICHLGKRQLALNGVFNFKGIKRIEGNGKSCCKKQSEACSTRVRQVEGMFLIEVFHDACCPRDKGKSEEVYVHQPLGFVDPAHPNKVYKVISNLFLVLHQARQSLQTIVAKFYTEAEYVVAANCCGKTKHIHMTGNKAYLSDYEDYNGGFVAFGSDPKIDLLTKGFDVIRFNFLVVNIGMLNL